MKLLKLSIDWRPRRLTELIERLYKVVQFQMGDLRRALYDHGNFGLANKYARFRTPHTAWQAKSPEEKDAHFAKPHNRRPKNGDIKGRRPDHASNAANCDEKASVAASSCSSHA